MACCTVSSSQSSMIPNFNMWETWQSWGELPKTFHSLPSSDLRRHSSKFVFQDIGKADDQAAGKARCQGEDYD